MSTRVLSPGKAVIWAAFFNFVAAFTFGTAVATTVGSGMIDIHVVTFAVIFGGLTGAIIWDLITWYYGLPTSSSHALIGGYAGAAVAKAGFAAIIAGGWTKTIIFIVLSPLHRPGRGSDADDAIFWMFRWTPPSRVDRWFRRLQLLSAAFFSLNHGANDAQKTMGIIAGVLFAAGYIQTFYIPFWVVLMAHAAIASRDAGRRLAHHPHDGVEDHEAAAGRRVCGGDRRRHRAARRPRISACPSARRTPSPARSSAWARRGGCRPCDGASPGRFVWAWVLTIPAAFMIGAGAYTLLRLAAQGSDDLQFTLRTRN